MRLELYELRRRVSYPTPHGLHEADTGCSECLLEFTPEQIAKMRKFAVEVRGL